MPPPGSAPRPRAAPRPPGGRALPAPRGRRPDLHHAPELHHARQVRGLLALAIVAPSCTTSARRASFTSSPRAPPGSAPRPPSPPPWRSCRRRLDGRARGRSSPLSPPTPAKRASFTSSPRAPPGSAPRPRAAPRPPGPRAAGPGDHAVADSTAGPAGDRRPLSPPTPARWASFTSSPRAPPGSAPRPPGPRAAGPGDRRP